MVRTQAVIDATEAVRWAARPCSEDPERTNYERLLEDAERAALAGSRSLLLDCPGVRAAHWPCLSRLLIMDKPELAAVIHPRWIAALDGPAGVASMQLDFRAATGRAPAARSWRHARESLAAL